MPRIRDTSFMRRLLVKLGLIVFARRIKGAIVPRQRSLIKNELSKFYSAKKIAGAHFRSRIEGPDPIGAVLVYGMDRIEEILLQAPLLLAFRSVGMRPTILLNSRASGWLEEGYRFFGADDFVYLEDYDHTAPHPKTRKLWEYSLSNGMKPIMYRNVPVGKYALSTLMRKTRRGNIDFNDQETRQLAYDTLNDSINFTDIAADIIACTKPVSALLIDRGYTPRGQLFNLAMEHAGNCFTWNAAHKNGCLMLKRYFATNMQTHPSTLSAKSWSEIMGMEWKNDKWQRAEAEICTAYKTGEWFSVAGGQINKETVDMKSLILRLGLDQTKKNAVIFSHIFWDSTFFWGEDIFGNFENWFKAAVQAACANPNLNWLIKVHPANAVKDRRDGFTGEHSEIKAIREIVDKLPPHIKVLPADFEVSTLSLLSITDYCLTVRGTIGIEAASLGIPVITAGTGRYDRMGFTIDPDSQKSYLSLLSRLHEIPPMTEEQIERARRFAYGIFIARPTPISLLRFGYRKDATASLYAELSPEYIRDPLNSPDVRAIADWISSSDEDFLSNLSSRN